MDAYEVDPQVRAARTWDGQAKAASAPAAVPPFRQRLTVAVGEGVLIGMKWLVASLLALCGIVWFLTDYAFVRDQAQYVAQVRAAQRAQQTAQPQPAAPKPGGPSGAER